MQYLNAIADADTGELSIAPLLKRLYKNTLALDLWS
jgi:hypothetical protein